MYIFCCCFSFESFPGVVLFCCSPHHFTQQFCAQIFTKIPVVFGSIQPSTWLLPSPVIRLLLFPFLSVRLFCFSFLLNAKYLYNLQLPVKIIYTPTIARAQAHNGNCCGRIFKNGAFPVSFSPGLFCFR